MAVTLRSIKLQSLEVLGSTPADGDSLSATVDYSFTFKRKISDRGVKIRTEQPLVKMTQRATFLRSEGQRWLLLDSVDIKPQGGGGAAAGAGAAAGGAEEGAPAASGVQQ
jgi:hypothetical protein